jgi:hypothetical protein
MHTVTISLQVLYHIHTFQNKIKTEKLKLLENKVLYLVALYFEMLHYTIMGAKAVLNEYVI